MNKLLIQITAAVFLVYGVAFVSIPIQMIEWVTGAGLSSSSAVIDVRATYGGMSLAVSVVLFILSKKQSTIGLGLVTVALFMFCMAFGRLIGIWLDGSANWQMYLYLALEVFVLVIALILLKLDNSKGK